MIVQKYEGWSSVHQRKSWSNAYKVSSCSVKGLVYRCTHQSCFKKYFNSLIDKLGIIDIYTFTWWISVGRYTHQSCFKKYFNSLINKLGIIDIYAFTWWISVGIGYISYKYLVITKSY